MGYQPSIDSYEEIYEGWGERREVVAWSAGTQIVMRVKETGANIEKFRKTEESLDNASDQPWNYDAFNHLNTWFTYRIPESIEGRDDVTSLKLLRPHQRDMAYEDMVLGTASGQLSLLSASPDLAETHVLHYDTGRRAVGATSITSSSAPMLAATLGDSTIALYSTNRDSCSTDSVKPITEVASNQPGLSSGRIWSCNFLSDDRIAVGAGPCHEPIQVYQIGADGFMSLPLRTFNLDSESNNSRVARLTSVYPILPIPSTARGGSEAGHTFLSGGYDGIIRLHDMRSPRSFEAMYWDPTNDSSVYSLAAQGLERIVVGVAMHSMIKVFDLRLSGSNTYHTVSMPSKPKTKPKRQQDFASNAIVNNTRSDVAAIAGGWNLYLNPRGSSTRNHQLRANENSPVYSLSIPSRTSQNVYAGMEGVVQNLTFHGIADPHPDPMLSQSLVRFPDSNAVDVRASYNPHDDVLNMGMYEQGSEEGLGMQLLVQDSVANNAVTKERKDAARAKGVDERWIDPRDEGRWARGEAIRGGDVPREQRRGRGRGRGARGRRRGG
jgi:WD40 repeat protein